jgi:hypothetical protein
MSIYGRIITGEDVRQATIAHLKRWTPVMLSEVAAQSGRERGDLPGFRAWGVAKNVDNWPENQLPACVVVAPGLAERPERHGDGTYRAKWSVGIGAVVSGQDLESTRSLVELYTAAVRSAMLQHPSLAQWDEAQEKYVPFALGVEWLDESYDELGFNDSRTIAAGVVSLIVEVDRVLDSFGGPVHPPPPPDPPPGVTTDPGDWGIVEAVTVTTEQSV